MAYTDAEFEQFKQAHEARFKPAKRTFLARLGHPDGSTIKVAGRPNFIYARLLSNSQVIQVLNMRAPLRYNLPVVLGYTDSLPEQLQVLDIYLPAAADGLTSEYSMVKAHGATHTWDGGDEVWVNQAQVMIGLPRSTGTFGLAIDQFAYLDNLSAVTLFDDYTSADPLSALVPATSGNAVWVAVTLDQTDGGIDYTAGSEWLYPDPDPTQYFPALPVGGIPLADILLIAGDTAITQDRIDGRRRLFVGNPYAGGSGATFTPGSVPFSGSAGTLTEDNTNFYWTAISGSVGGLRVGPAVTNAPANHFLVSGSAYAKGYLLASGATVADFSAWGVGRSRGTSASPAAVETGDLLGRVDFYGYTGAQWAACGRIEAYATENWSASNRGEYLSIRTTATSASTSRETIRAAADGELYNETSGVEYPYWHSGNIGALTKDPTGFSNPQAVTITYDPTARTIALSGTFTAYWQGKLIPALTNGWTSGSHANANGLYFLSYNGSAFVWNTSVWSFDQLQIAYVYYQGSGSAASTFAIRECHGLMPWEVHEEFHETIGCYRESGGTLSNWTAGSAGDGARRPIVAATVLHDEDCITTNGSAAAGSYTQLSLSGSAADTVFVQGALDIVALNVNRPYYNQFTGGAWQPTLMTNNLYMSVWLMGMPVAASAQSQKFRYLWLQGQSESNLQGQQALTPSSLSLNAFAAIAPEFVFLAQVIIQYTATNWVINSVVNLSGNRYSQVASPSGVYLSTVNATYPLQGLGTSGSPLTLAAATAGSAGSLSASDFVKISQYNNQGYTLTVPASGSAALLGTANVFTAAQTIKKSGLTELNIEATGDNYLNLYLTRSGVSSYTARQWGIGLYSTGGLAISDITAGLARVSIDTSGNVGIRTSDPGAALNIKTTDVNSVPLIISAPGTSTRSVSIGLGSATDSTTAPDYGARIRSDFNWGSDAGASITLQYRTAGGTLTDGVKLDVAGKVGVGMSPVKTLDVNGSLMALDYYSGDGSQGVSTATFSIPKYGSPSVRYNLTFTDGLLTAFAEV